MSYDYNAFLIFCLFYFGLIYIANEIIKNLLDDHYKITKVTSFYFGVFYLLKYRQGFRWQIVSHHKTRKEAYAFMLHICRDTDGYYD